MKYTKPELNVVLYDEVDILTDSPGPEGPIIPLEVDEEPAEF